MEDSEANKLFPDTENTQNGSSLTQQNENSLSSSQPAIDGSSQPTSKLKNRRTDESAARTSNLELQQMFIGISMFTVLFLVLFVSKNVETNFSNTKPVARLKSDPEMSKFVESMKEDLYEQRALKKFKFSPITKLEASDDLVDAEIQLGIDKVLDQMNMMAKSHRQDLRNMRDNMDTSEPTYQSSRRTIPPATTHANGSKTYETEDNGKEFVFTMDVEADLDALGLKDRGISHHEMRKKFPIGTPTRDMHNK